MHFLSLVNKFYTKINFLSFFIASSKTWWRALFLKIPGVGSKELGLVGNDSNVNVDGGLIL
jgi:hypothetical protein